MAKMRRGLAAISSHKSSLTLDELRRRPAPVAISAKMLAILQKVDATDKAHLAGLRESARQEAENDKKRRAAGRRPARARLTNKKTPATEASRAEGSMHAVAQSAQTPGGAAARGELFAGLVRAARPVVAQKAKKTKAVRRRDAKPTGKKP